MEEIEAILTKAARRRGAQAYRGEAPPIPATEMTPAMREEYSAGWNEAFVKDWEEQ